MTWTKLSDNWTDRSDLAELSFEDRWHYLAMIQLCSRAGNVTGVLKPVDARRCSDNSDPVRALLQLQKAGLIESSSTAVRILEIDEHIPPPSVRNKAEADKVRKRRSRAHKEGDHSLCLTDHCPLGKITPVTRDIVRDPGTGRDGPGPKQVTFAEETRDDVEDRTDSRTGEIFEEPKTVRREGNRVHLVPRTA
ncbi:hypothetical protein HRK28_04610 [Rathayibacter sp. VKM Ac-2835]|uniref:hypothetical protein n=1 Tax=Rathayibacter sp. VKM Ac-2835 TaxID=2739043 RepID=UPI0015670C39|nr:hypothetical protein [Rathayibacter sp. VKM Ac-2835]NRG40196.1 hypothetical protein [Rathayibacter sp. VKM Ac-2835]